MNATATAANISLLTAHSACQPLMSALLHVCLRFDPLAPHEAFGQHTRYIKSTMLMHAPYCHRRVHACTSSTGGVLLWLTCFWRIMVFVMPAAGSA